MTLRHMAPLYLLQGQEILLIHKPHSRLFSAPLWCGVGGHFEAEEMDQPEACLLREVYEEAGFTPSDLRDLRLRYVILRRRADEIRQQYVFFARAARPLATPPPCDEGIFQWVPVDRLEELDMSFSNRRCLRHYFETGCHDALLYAGVVQAPGFQPEMAFVPMRDFATDYDFQSAGGNV